MNEYYVYIMTNPWHTLYVGVTSDLVRRAHAPKPKLVPGFTAQYNLTRLVYFEPTGDVGSAIAREKQLKGWLRKKKMALIELVNPKWQDLSLAWGAGESESLPGVYPERDSSTASLLQNDSEGLRGDRGKAEAQG